MFENDKQILSGAADRTRGIGITGSHLANYYDHSMNSNNERVGAKISGKGLIRFHGSAGSASHGSQFNYSASGFTPTTIQKLSDVKNPQKELILKFINKKAQKLPELSFFKNLRELDLSGNLLNEEIKELNSLNYLKNLNLSNNKI